MSTVTETTDCVVGVHACGCITYWSADPQDKDAAKTAAGFIAEGGQVVRRSTDELRSDPLFLPSECPHEPKGWERPAPPNPDEWKVRARRARYYSGGEKKRVEATNRFFHGYVTAGFIIKPERATWYGTCGWFDDAGITANDGSSDRKPVEVFGPFRTEKEAKHAVGSAWHSAEVEKAKARWEQREANPPKRTGAVPTHTESGAPVPPFKPGEVWVSRGFGSRYLILDEPEVDYRPAWRGGGGGVHVRARSLDDREPDPMRQWMTPTWTYLGESMFAGPGWMDRVEVTP